MAAYNIKFIKQIIIVNIQINFEKSKKKKITMRMIKRRKIIFFLNDHHKKIVMCQLNAKIKLFTFNYLTLEQIVMYEVTFKKS